MAIKNRHCHDCALTRDDVVKKHYYYMYMYIQQDLNKLLEAIIITETYPASNAKASGSQHLVNICNIATCIKLQLRVP